LNWTGVEIRERTVAGEGRCKLVVPIPVHVNRIALRGVAGPGPGGVTPRCRRGDNTPYSAPPPAFHRLP